MARPPNTTPDAFADANLLIAFLAGGAHPFHEAATTILTRMDRGALRVIVDPIIVAEIMWAGASALGRARDGIAALLLELLDSDGFEVTDRRTVRDALELQVAHPRLDFADAWLAARARTVGPAAVASFDADLDAIPGIERVMA